MSESQHSRGLLWHQFLYEVNKATASLMYLLQGVESVRESELVPYNQMTTANQQFAACFPKLSYVGVPLSMSGIGFDLNDVLEREAAAEQLAFKGWVEQIYFLWEGWFRNQMKDSFRDSGIIRPEGDTIGDFRHIRNDLIHHNGVASKDETGKCTVLKWFKPGEPIVLGMRHVFDFLNQLGFMTRSPGFLDDGAAAAWVVFPGMEEDLVSGPTPGIVSLRTSMDKVLDNGSSWHVVSVVFENGVFVTVPVLYYDDGSTPEHRIDLFKTTCIDSDGDLRLPKGHIKTRKSLYKEAVDALFGKGPKIDGLGVPGPPFRFRKE